MPGMIQQDLPEELHKWLKVEAAMQGITKKELVKRAITAYRDMVEKQKQTSMEVNKGE